MKTTVLYHDDTDGFCAAWVASKYLPEDTEYRAVQYGQDPPWEMIDGRAVYVLDFSYKRAVMEEIIARSGRVICLDHHRTAEAELAGLPGCEFDMERAGCRMTWDFFIGKYICKSPLRELIINYVQDRDLWKFELEDSHIINAAIRSWPTTFDAWDRMAERHGNIFSEGRAILRNEQRQVESILRNARQVTLDGHRVWAVNTPILISECAGELAKRPLVYVSDPPLEYAETVRFDPLFGLAWFQKSDGKVVVSLRSRGDFDVSELARKMGGGGHKGAAGFEMEDDADAASIFLGVP